jgi:Uma2 family endonuclease
VERGGGAGAVSTRIPISTLPRGIPSGYAERVKQAPLTVRRWKRVEYDRLVELGAFDREPLELIGGQLIVAEPQGVHHASSIRRIDYALRAVLPPGWIVSIQSPVSLDDESEPEPDLAVVQGGPGDYSDAHPTRPALAIEVAESSLAFDRRDKGSLYARAGLQDYWIVNLVDRVLEVYREPAPDPSAPYGWSYRSVARLTAPAVVELAGVSGARVAVADLLP